MTAKQSTSDTAAAANLRTISARGNLHGMTVQFEGETWTVLDRHPRNGCWWIHRRNAAGEWITDFARYHALKQIIN